LEFLEWLEKLNAKEYPHLKLKRKRRGRKDRKGGG